MARYFGPVCKLCRREGMKLYLKGDRCLSEKCSFTRRPYPPGQHGQGRIKMSEYGLRLREPIASAVKRPMVTSIEADRPNYAGTVKGLPAREELNEPAIREQYVVEYYSR